VIFKTSIEKHGEGLVFEEKLTATVSFTIVQTVTICIAKELKDLD